MSLRSLVGLSRAHATCYRLDDHALVSPAFISAVVLSSYQKSVFNTGLFLGNNSAIKTPWHCQRCRVPRSDELNLVVVSGDQALCRRAQQVTFIAQNCVQSQVQVGLVAVDCAWKRSPPWDRLAPDTNTNQTGQILDMRPWHKKECREYR